MTKNLLIIFTRNPVLGKCKTRLATTIGDKAALKIYTFLLEHTVSITKNLAIDKQVHYSDEISSTDLWSSTIYKKIQQEGDDLGERMRFAFKQGFESGYERIVIIGSDIYDLEQSNLEEAFFALTNHDYVIGPATDGGYYLLGMKKLNEKVFRNKNWGTPTVLQDTLEDLKGDTLFKLQERNDVDIYEDIKDIAIFKEFIGDKQYD